VLLFFIDLYNVFKETDRVLKPNGIQSWIIGNRTVLGEVNVPLSDILSEWFQAFNYSQLTSLARKYSFKRLPHHMNSALDRDQQISSMMEEYIIVYQK
jgi:ubiquinone/menaquinone biosynthesis C-methylase UbiE